MEAPVTIVTGAAGAVGQALCTAFAAQGDRVIGMDLPGMSCAPGVGAIEADLEILATDDAYRGEILSRIRKELRTAPLRVLINNAAVQIARPAEDLSVQDLQRTLDVNTVAPFLLTQGVLSELRRARGSVINIASIHAVQSKPGFVAYATSKAALVGLTRSMALEFAPAVRVNCISPAAVDTPMLRAGLSQQDMDRLGDYHPLLRIAQPSEVAAIAVFLASGAAGFVTGSNVFIDGGISGVLSDPAGNL